MLRGSISVTHLRDLPGSHFSPLRREVGHPFPFLVSVSRFRFLFPFRFSVSVAGSGVHGIHEKLHFFSRRSEAKSRLTTITSMPSEIAAPRGQL